MAINKRDLVLISNHSANMETDKEILKGEISKYIDLILQDVNGNLKKSFKSHLVSKFILENFGEKSDPNNKDSRCDLQVIRFTFEENNGSPDFLAKQLKDTTNNFSKRVNFYTSEDYLDKLDVENNISPEDASFIENLLGTIERNSAPMIKFRQKEKSYRYKTKPYFYEDSPEYHSAYNESVKTLDTEQGKRIALSVFFASQILRSSFLVDKFLRHKQHIEEFGSRFKVHMPETVVRVDGKLKKVPAKDLSPKEYMDIPSFKDFFVSELYRISESMYFRSWRWIYSEYDLIIPAGNTISPVLLKNGYRGPDTVFNFLDALAPFTRRIDFWNSKYQMMSIGKNTAVYFKEEDSFFTEYDGVFTSKSIPLNMMAITSILRGAAVDFFVRHQNNSYNKNVEIALHPTSTIAHIIRSPYPTNEAGKEKYQSLKSRWDKYFDRIDQQILSDEKDYIFLIKILRSGEIIPGDRYTQAPIDEGEISLEALTKLTTGDVDEEIAVPFKNFGPQKSKQFVSGEGNIAFNFPKGSIVTVKSDIGPSSIITMSEDVQHKGTIEKVYLPPIDFIAEEDDLEFLQENGSQIHEDEPYCELTIKATDEDFKINKILSLHPYHLHKTVSSFLRYSYDELCDWEEDIPTWGWVDEFLIDIGESEFDLDIPRNHIMITAKRHEIDSVLAQMFLRL